MDKAIKISVVCPTFNSSRFIEKALTSVVHQARRPEEVIICDDGSSDDTTDVVERFVASHGEGINWKVERILHRGPGAARNTGIANAQGDWIAFLDSDDLWHPEKLRRVEAAIVANSDANFFCHAEQRVDKKGRISRLESFIAFRPDRPLPPQLYLRNLFSTSAVTCSKELLLTHGMFSERLMSAQDYELWLRLSLYVRPVFLPYILGYYVERDGNISSGKLHKRMANELRIAVAHRHLASKRLFLQRIGRIVLSYLRQWAVRIFQSTLRVRLPELQTHK